MTKLLVNVKVYGNKPNTLHKKITRKRKINIEKYSFLYNAVFDFKTELFINKIDA